MDHDPLPVAARLLRDRIAIDAKIAAVIGRPMAAGHLGEWIAARVFDIELESNATTAGFDGRFTAGALNGRTVNVKWYLKREGFLDLTDTDVVDYYLVLTGPTAPATHSRGAGRPWCITSAYLFDARLLLNDLHGRGVKIAVASSVRAAQWEAAQIYPEQRSQALSLQPAQVERLRQFAL
ncbi:hypothetical protein [Plantactinospora alkalitolerans]|uniref:hypothetical protein n=1 Tax=Plantactinospora alkalitolerans TaxID=2789879 RepID=UPI001E56A3BD|nr:hypothetical protein [Plantactinospora alkalitolerans]